MWSFYPQKVYNQCDLQWRRTSRLKPHFWDLPTRREMNTGGGMFSSLTRPRAAAVCTAVHARPSLLHKPWRWFVRRFPFSVWDNSVITARVVQSTSAFLLVWTPLSSKARRNYFPRGCRVTLQHLVGERFPAPRAKRRRQGRGGRWGGEEREVETQLLFSLR